MALTYGRALRERFNLAADATFLNHGSFGACPLEILAEQERLRSEMESGPDAFFRGGIFPTIERSRLREALAGLAPFVHAREDQLAFIENATAGTQAALKSIAFARGDRILLTDHGYKAVRLMVEARCAETGAEAVVVQIPIPTDAEAIVARIAEAASRPIKLAILDHITSPTALLFPLERIVPLLRSQGALIFIDGAHGVGQVPLDLEALGVDWYVSNLHKWLFAPKGTAFLYASDAVAAITRPNVVSHYIAMGFPRNFDYTGTRDNTGWLCTPAALRFFEALGPAGVREHAKRVLDAFTEALAPLGVEPIAPTSLCAAMRSFVLPQSRPVEDADVGALTGTLWERERIYGQSMAWNGRLLFRVSAAAYVDAADAPILARALDRHGWPARRARVNPP
jgi:isopenicillin-N epimerase